MHVTKRIFTIQYTSTEDTEEGEAMVLDLTNYAKRLEPEKDSEYKKFYKQFSKYKKLLASTRSCLTKQKTRT